MKLRNTLGNTGVELSRLGMGGHTFLPRYGGMDRADWGELRNIVTTAVEEGINLFDVTWDEERRVLGALLKDLGDRDSVFLMCWLSRKLTQTAVDVTAEAERALSLLQLDQVDLLYLDWTCTPEQAEAMVALRDARLTRFIGVLGTETALSSDMGALLVNHNYYMQEKEEAIRRINQLNPHLGIISLEPIGRGRFAMDSAPCGVSMSAACLKYALGFELADATLIAVRRLSQLQENIEVWKSAAKLTSKERVAMESGKGYEMPKPK